MSYEDTVPVETVLWGIAAQSRELDRQMKLLQQQQETLRRQFEGLVAKQEAEAEELPGEKEFKAHLVRIGEYVDRKVPHVHRVFLRLEEQPDLSVPFAVTMESRLVGIEEGSDYCIRILTNHSVAKDLVRKSFVQTADDGEEGGEVPKPMKNALRNLWEESEGHRIRYTKPE